MKILLIEDHKMMATSLKDSLEKEGNIEIDILENIEDIFDLVKSKKYDLLIMDINLNGLTKSDQGLDMSKTIIEEFKDVKIVILTGYNLTYYQERAKKIGCYGFISKEEDTNTLVTKLKRILYNNEKIFPVSQQEYIKLTPIEIKIVKLYSSGLTREEVAIETFMSLRSLAVALNRIYKKLGVKNYQQMTKEARKLGYIDTF